MTLAQGPFSVDILGAEAGTVGFHQEAAHLAAMLFAPGPHHGHVGDGAGGDPHLFAVQHIAIWRRGGAGAHRPGVRTGIGLGEAKAAKLFALGHGRQPAILLRVAAKGINGIHHQAALHAGKAAQAAIAALQLLHDEAVLHVVHARAAVALNGGAEEAKLAHGSHDLPREAALAVALLDNGDKVVFHELAGGGAHHALVFCQQRVEFQEVNAAIL